MKIINIKINKLNPSEYNPRLDLQLGDKEYEDIKRSVVEFGLVEPLVVNKDMTVIGGHQRLKVLRELNLATIPCIIVDLNKQKEKMLNVALNKISGGWDRPKLKDLLLELDTGEFDMNLTGWDEQEIESLMTEFHIEPEEDDFDVDKAVEEVGEPICKRGGIWQLNSHRLMCGDATVEEDVKRLMDGKKADMVFTDPPYGNNLGYGRGQLGERYILNDDNTKILEKIFIPIDANLKNNSHCLIWIQWRTFSKLEKEINKYKLRTVIVWDKEQAGLSGSGFAEQYEMICVFIKGGITQNRYSGNVWRYPREHSERKDSEHPHKKPIEVIGRGLDLCSQKGNIILDLFLGSGSTLIACEQLNRICYGMEIDPIYCDVIIKRWEQYTQKKAVKLNG